MSTSETSSLVSEVGGA